VKRVILLLVFAAASGYAWWLGGSQTSALAPKSPDEYGARSGDIGVAAAFEARARSVEIYDSGAVAKLLRDDRDGEPHQRFIVRVGSGQTVLIAHNIDEAPRIDALREGDAVQFRGVYEWSARGGVVHWTHDDPGGDHAEGWVRHEGRIYQ